MYLSIYMFYSVLFVYVSLTGMDKIGTCTIYYGHVFLYIYYNYYMLHPPYKTDVEAKGAISTVQDLLWVVMSVILQCQPIALYVLFLTVFSSNMALDIDNNHILY